MKRSLFISIAILISPILTYAEVMLSGHPEYPPFMWQSGDKIVGVGAKLGAAIFEELKMDYKIVSTGPWKRVQENAKEGSIDMIVGAYINDDRQSYMDYTIPYATDPVGIFVPKGKDFKFEKWEDLIGKKGVTIRGESFGQELDAFVAEKLEMSLVNRYEQNFKVLESGRVDYSLCGVYACLSKAVTTGNKGKFVPLKHHVSSENFYMTVSKKSKHRHLLPKINELITRFSEDGTIDKWIDEALLEYEVEKTQTP